MLTGFRGNDVVSGGPATTSASAAWATTCSTAARARTAVAQSGNDTCAAARAPTR
jgi:hypothetical protein